jgi:thiol:disulfide interchange protein
LGAAFIGGLILNLRPCVLPVLSLKVFSLMKHAGENPKTAWIQGVAFTAGVVLSFWALAGLLLVLRSAGNHLGWGFQMQSPGFVLALIFLFFLLALNLFGVFELGSSLVGLDAKATGHLGGLASSFGNGALATLAATPCTAPFMGSALGFAAQQPAFVSMLIFTFLALGMAAPYLLLTIFPGALRFVPKPGAWMEAFKQFMGFLLMATVIFLVYVLGALVGDGEIYLTLFVLLLAALAAWIYGRWATPINTLKGRIRAYILVAFLVFCVVSRSSEIVGAIPPEPTKGIRGSSAAHDVWQPWTTDAVSQALDKGQPVFVDFTAAWCLSCKVNERLALDTDAVKKAFADKNVALFRADWTHADPEISKTLQQYNRDGVPLYLLYSPKDKANPQVLPAVLTPGIVLDAVGKL